MPSVVVNTYVVKKRDKMSIKQKKHLTKRFMAEQVGQFLNGELPEWEGSASELVEKLGLNIGPNILTRKLNVNARTLRDQYGVAYSSRHTRDGSRIKLKRMQGTCDDGDGCDGIFDSAK